MNAPEPDPLEVEEYHLMQALGVDEPQQIHPAIEKLKQQVGMLRARVEETDAVLAELPGLIAETARQLDAISGGEPDADHGEADRILLDFAPPEIREAYERLVKRSGWWATA